VLGSLSVGVEPVEEAGASEAWDDDSKASELVMTLLATIVGNDGDCVTKVSIIAEPDKEGKALNVRDDGRTVSET